MSFKLARLARRGFRSGELLPDVYGTLKRKGIRFRRGGVHLIAGTPGSMKTMLIINLVDEMKIPTLYISNDSNEMTIISRMLSRRTKVDSELTAERARTDPDWAFLTLSDMDWVRWNFNPSPSLEEIEEEILAFEELWGDAPHLVVVDVLMKVDYDEGSPYATDEGIVRFLDKLSRDSSACFIVAGHTSENEAGNPCQPLKAVLNKVSKLPVMVLTTAYSNGILYVAPVKNRDGFADPTGKTTVEFLIDPAIATIEEIEV